MSVNPLLTAVLLTVLSLLCASPDKALPKCNWLKTSLADSGPCDTIAAMKVRHWRTNLPQMRKEDYK